MEPQNIVPFTLPRTQRTLEERFLPTLVLDMSRKMLLTRVLLIAAHATEPKQS